MACGALFILEPLLTSLVEPSAESGDGGIFAFSVAAYFVGFLLWGGLHHPGQQDVEEDADFFLWWGTVITSKADG